MIDCTPEMASAIDRIEPRHISRLIAAGVPQHIASPSNGDPHRWGIVKVQPEGSHLYVPDQEDGKEAYVAFATHHGCLIDLIAFSPAAPTNWRWRVGDTPILNDDFLDLPYIARPVAELVATPLDWLRSGCTAMVVLDWNAKRDLRRFAMEGQIIAPAAIIHRLDTILREPVNLPKFTPMKEAHRNVA